MALQDILDQIKKETEAKLKKLNDAHDKKLKALDEEYSELMKKASEEMDEQVELNKKKILNKMTTHARMEAKNKLLKEKRAILDEVFEAALEALVNGDNYAQLVGDLLKKSKMGHEEVEVIPAKGKEDATRRSLEASGKPYKMSHESADIKGGFILRSDKVEVDNSFASILYKQLRDDLELEIAQSLYA